MYKIIYPRYNNTLYEDHQFRNSGADQILTLEKKTAGSYVPDILSEEEAYGFTYSSRIIMKFDLTDIQTDISSGRINGPVTYYLKMIPVAADELPLDYTVYIHPLSGSWLPGTGFFNNVPEIRNGSSWKYRTDYLTQIPWFSGSLAAGVTGSYVTNSGGGTWYTSSLYTATQSFSSENPEINCDVTNIVNSWLSGSLVNNGMIIKHSTANETNDSILGSIRYFGTSTHTIYIPRLEIHWPDYTLSGTGSFDEITGDQYVLLCKNLKDTYIVDEIPRINLNIRERYPQRTYATSSYYLQSKRIPTGSYYSIYDYIVDEEIVRFSEGTRVSCDGDGNFIKLDIGSLLPERYYKLIFKVNNSDGSIKIIDDGFYFKVRRI